VPRLKLKDGLTFVPEGGKFLVLDEETSSKFRIGAAEHLILTRFEETISLEEVSYAFRANPETNIPYDKLSNFITQAINLNLLVPQRDTLWGRMLTIRASNFRIRLFDPTHLIGVITQRCRFLFNWIGVALVAAALVPAFFLLSRHLSEIWAFRSLSLPSSYFFVLAVVFVLSIGHEVAHGVAGKWYGFEAPEVGFHLHYFIPAFYCKIFRRHGASRKSLAVVLLSGSVFDLLIMSGALGLWWVASGPPRQWLSIAVSLLLVKVWAIQLNPLWPYSDGYHLVSVLFFNREGKSGE
jgi:hypothetical protein